MKHKRNLLASALLVPALLAMNSLGESPTFSPKAGSTLTKMLTTTTTLSMEDMSMVMNGQDMSDMMEMEMETEVVVSAKIVDTYDEVADGRPVKLTRTYEELGSDTNVKSSNPMTGDVDLDAAGSSSLEGQTVVFSWDADDEDYSIAFGEDSDGDDELLEGLAEDLDLRAFLPDDDVSEGDAWSVDTGAMKRILAPGGSLKIEPADDSQSGMGMGGNSPSNFGEFLEDFDGEITATLDEVREEEGSRMAVISLSFETSSATDMTEWMEEMMAEAEMPEGMEIEMDVESFDMEFTFEGSGELLWNLGGGHFQSLEISGEISQVVDTAMNIAAGGMEQAIEQSMTMAGTQSIQFSVEN